MRVSSFLLWQIFYYFDLYPKQLDLEIRTEMWADNIPVFPVFQIWNWASLQKSGQKPALGYAFTRLFHCIGFSHPWIQLKKYYYERIPSGILQTVRNLHYIFWRHSGFFVCMRSCYPLFPTDVWSMIFQIFLENTRESADTLATPLKKAQTQFINKIITELYHHNISYNILVLISVSHLVVLIFYKCRCFFLSAVW